MESPHLYHVEDPSLFSVATVMEATCNQGHSLLWCMEVGLIDWQKLCPTCGSNMKPSCATKRWRCSRHALHANRKEVSRGMLTSVFFSDSKLKLHHSARLFLAWCMRLPQATAIEMAEVSERTVTEWYMFCRSTCSKEFLKADFKFFYVSLHYKLAVKYISSKLMRPASQRNVSTTEDVTIKSIGSLEKLNEFRVNVYDKRTKATLLPIIKRFIKPRGVTWLPVSHRFLLQSVPSQAQPPSIQVVTQGALHIP
ncbi:hypothetical protein P3T76_003480 [Phytophthora citrophthora]|uniref:Uncharacterized protein n=1 Tax=Phytophthora citrophthora TaxID=4793 RepID=A0AAD9LRV9_9STRA|nr:hypothetical protein P3T76_003480 [Phytophthora citrophthora]